MKRCVALSRELKKTALKKQLERMATFGQSERTRCLFTSTALCVVSLQGDNFRVAEVLAGTRVMQESCGAFDWWPNGWESEGFSISKVPLYGWSLLFTLEVALVKGSPE